MHDPLAFDREFDSRKGLEDSATVISIIDRHPLGDVTADSLQAVPQVRLSTEKPKPGETPRPTTLNLLLVLERGSNDLSDITSHGDFAGINMLTVRAIAASIAKCLQTMHAKGVLHGDVKSRNFVLLTTGEHAAIDLDTAATIDPSAAATLCITDPRQLPAICLAGQKPTSSGCLPPEQAAVVLHRRRRAAAIFKHLAAGADELSEAMLNRFYGDVGFDEHDRPELTALDGDGNGQVSACEFAVFFGDLKYEAKLVRFVDSKGAGGDELSQREANTRQRLEAERIGASTARDWVKVAKITTEIEALTAADNRAIPLPVVANPSYDTWCFGVMLYELATGYKLFESNVREEVDDATLAKIAEWSDDQKKLLLDRVANKPIRLLLAELLEKDPDLRLCRWPDIITALQAGGDLDGMVSGLHAHIAAVNRHVLENHQVLRTLSTQLVSESAATRQLMLDVKNVEVPCLFEIVDVEKETVAGQIRSALSVEAVDVEADALNALAADNPAAFEVRSKGAFRKRIERARRLCRETKAAIQDPAKAVSDWVARMADKKVELRLLCGITLEPVVRYSIDCIDEDVAELAVQGSKMIRVGLKVAAGWNCVAGVATRLFGLPVPTISEAATDGGKDAKAFLDELKDRDDDLTGVQATEETGMDLEQLQAFAGYLEMLEERAGVQPKWKEKMFRVEDKAVSGRLTWAAAAECGVYGGNVHKAGIAMWAAAAMAKSCSEGGYAAMSLEYPSFISSYASNPTATGAATTAEVEEPALAGDHARPPPWAPTGTPGVLTIAVVKCDHLPQPSGKSQPDTYVSIRLIHKTSGAVLKSKTSTKQESCNPVYESPRNRAEFEIEDGLENYTCEVLVKRASRFMSYHLAHCKLAIVLVPREGDGRDKTVLHFGPKPIDPAVGRAQPIGPPSEYACVLSSDENISGGAVHLRVIDFKTDERIKRERRAAMDQAAKPAV